MSTMAEAKCTDEQKAEWNALLERMQELHQQAEDALRQAGDFIRFGIVHGDEETCHRLAREWAQKAIDTREERACLDAEYEAHPYTAEVNARREQA